MVKGRVFISFRLAILLVLFAQGFGFFVGYVKAKQEDAQALREAAQILREVNAALVDFHSPRPKKETVDL